MQAKWVRKKSGFTIVELLIVIVVIGILAAITIVAYNGIQQRGRDAQRKSDLANIAKAYALYKVDKGDFMSTGSGCGAAGNGNGWFNYGDGNPANYPTSMSACLKNSGVISNELKDPSGQLSCGNNTPGSCRAYMKYNCGTTVYIFASLESIGTPTTATDATCQPNVDLSYGMNYFVTAD